MKLIDKIYLKFFVKSGFAYAEYLKKKNFFNAQGENTFIAKSAEITDPYLTNIGSNVWITAGCKLLCHDASVIMINIMNNSHLDRVSPIIIHNNSFLGNNVIVLPGVTIGENTIIGTGSVVTKDVPGNSLYAGNPARFICGFEEYVQKIEKNTLAYSWHHLLKKHKRHVFDPELEEQLKIERKKYFFKT